MVRAESEIELAIPSPLPRFALRVWTADEHVSELGLSLPEDGAGYSVFQDGRKLELHKSRNWDFPASTEIKLHRSTHRIEIRRNRH